MLKNSNQKSLMWSRRGFLSVALSGTAGLCFQARPVFAASYPEIKAYRNPGCGCCEKWVGNMRAAGFTISMEDDPDLATRKTQLGVPDDLSGCHTALTDDYVIEGHVPPDDIILFLAEKSSALGLAVPGMPMGSSGMEMDGMKDPYQVIVFNKDGSRKVYASHS